MKCNAPVSPHLKCIALRAGVGCRVSGVGIGNSHEIRLSSFVPLSETVNTRALTAIHTGRVRIVNPPTPYSHS